MHSDSPPCRYYLLIILNGGQSELHLSLFLGHDYHTNCRAVAALLYALFYYPPTFHQKHGSAKVSAWIKDFDFVGLFLYIAGLALFIIGLSSGGDGLWPWENAKTISFIVLGFICLVGLFRKLRQQTLDIMC